MIASITDGFASGAGRSEPHDPVIEARPTLATDAAWSPDPGVNLPIATGSAHQRMPRLVSDGAGGAFVAWASGSNGTLVQGVDSTGRKLWPSAVIVADGAFVAPGLVPDDSGGVIVTCYKPPVPPSNYLNLSVARIGSGPRWNWQATTSLYTSVAPLPTPAIVSDGAHGAIVTRAAQDPDDRSFATIVFVHRIGATGVPLWPWGGVRVSPSRRSQVEPRAVSDGAGGAILVWLDYRFGDGDLYATRLNAAGEAVWQDVEIVRQMGRQGGQVVVSDGAGGVIVAWEDDRSGQTDLYAQRIDHAGVPRWTPQGVPVCTAAGIQNQLAITADGSGGAIVAWSDAREAPAAVYVQRIGADGSVQWPLEGRPVGEGKGAQTAPTVTDDGSAGAIVAWEDARGDSDIYGQHVDHDGQLTWRAEGEALGRARAPQRSPSCVSSGAGHAIVAWQDERDSWSSIMAQHTGYMDHCIPAVSADFSASATTNGAPVTVQFNDLSTGPVTSWQWDFENDGVIDATTANPAHVYTSLGTYTVALTVSDGTCPSTRVRPGLITVTPCSTVMPDFTADTVGVSPFFVSFTDRSTGAVNSWQWDFENDGVIDATTPNPTHIYTVPGNYSVALTVSDGSCVRRTVRTGFIHVLPCNTVAADFRASVTSGGNPLTVQFEDLSTGPVTSWRWDFENDGVIDATVRDPVAVYADPGSYSVALTVSDGTCENRRLRLGYIQVSRTIRDTLLLGANSPASTDTARTAVVFAGRDSLGALSTAMYFDTHRMRFVRFERMRPGRAFTTGVSGGRIAAQWLDVTGGANPLPAGRETLFVMVFAHLTRAGENSQVSFDTSAVRMVDPRGVRLFDVTVLDRPPYGLISFPAGTSTLSGKVGYYLGSRGVPGAGVVLSPLNLTFTTGAYGEFTFPTLPDGRYVLRASKTGDLGGINSLDGLKILRYGAGLESFSGSQKLAADVNLDGRVDVIDAFLIVRASLGLDTLRTPDWKVSPDSIVVSSLVNDSPGRNFSALRYGDVNGDWAPTPAPLAPPLAEQIAAPVRLALPDVAVEPDTSLELALHVTGLRSAAALSLRIRQVGSGLGLRSVTTEAAGVQVLSNQVGDQIRIEWLDPTGGLAPLSIAEGTLLTLAFDVVGEAGDSCALEWDSAVIGDTQGTPVSGIETIAAHVRIGHPDPPGPPDPSDPPDASPMFFELHPLAPNPFDGSTGVRFALARSGSTRLEVFDVNGRLVRTLLDRTLDAGEHAIDFDGRDIRGVRLGSGVYVVRLASGGATQARKLVLMP